MSEAVLFFSAFLAATVLPFSSEVAFLVAIESGMSSFNAVFFASSGNILAVIVNYYLGFLLYEKTKNRLKSSKIGRHSLACGHRYGYWALFVSWLPIVGDPLTLVAGVVRLRFIWFVLIAGSLRVARYYVLLSF